MYLGYYCIKHRLDVVSDCVSRQQEISCVCWLLLVAILKLSSLCNYGCRRHVVVVVVVDNVKCVVIVHS